ncbi:hypothetical protein DFH09DRAFT_1083874 [Mycena vulgaris]|nr:hypothetical protein DFH09DRAFT_1083874 [Mycena vulgaris]
MDDALITLRPSVPMRGTDRGLRRLDARGRLIHRGPNEAEHINKLASIGRKPGRGKIKIEGINWHSWYRASRRGESRRKARGGNEGRIRVSFPGGPESKGSKNAGERRGNNAWSARSRCAAQGRKKRREAGALESGDIRSEDTVWRRRREAHVGMLFSNLEGHVVGTEPRLDDRNGGVRQKPQSRECGGRRGPASASLLYTVEHNYAINRDAQSSWGAQEWPQQDTGSGRIWWRHPAGTGARKERASGGGSGDTKAGSVARQGKEGAQRGRPTFAVLLYKSSYEYLREERTRGDASTSTVVGGSKLPPSPADRAAATVMAQEINQLEEPDQEDLPNIGCSLE